MSLTPQQQFHKLTRESNAILIFLPAHPHGDAIGSAKALTLLFEKQEKSVTVASDTLVRASEPYAFLRSSGTPVETLSGARDFILSFNTKHNKIQGIRTEEENNEYRIFITPERGSVDPRDFSFIPARFKFDLVIVLGAPDKESLGKLYENNADIFYEVPTVNIDHHAKNENFGQLNIVDMTASSTSEVLAALLDKTHADWMDADIAECLLTGIISATESFQKKNTTPKALQTASKLMDVGANQQRIVLHLYKTQPLHLLKLWGRIMAKLEWDASRGLVWATVTQDDLAQAQASAQDLPRILEKVKMHYSAGSFFLLLFQESHDRMRGILKTTPPETLALVADLWSNEGRLSDDTFEFPLHQTDASIAIHEIAAKLSTFLAKN
jgi:nanoRNase/pAp phosphatase (c-di-AMP/oligoRNAs hydrolase)